MNWKKWPYWLRGGVIGGGITLVFVISFYSCGLIATGYSAFACFAFVLVGPTYPAVKLLDVIGSIFNFKLDGIFAEMYGPVLSILVWFIIGSLIGVLVDYIKLENKKSS